MSELIALDSNRLALVFCSALLAFVASTSSASAAGTVSNNGSSITYAAGANDGANTLNVDYSAFTYILTDSVDLTAGSNCAQSSSKVVYCAATLPKFLTLNMGDGLDLAQVTTSVPSGGQVTINGDSGGTNVSSWTGAPTFVNSTMGTSFNTGPGPDNLNLGGPGFSADIRTGASADVVTFSTDLPKVSGLESLDPSPYPAGQKYFEEAWPVLVHTDEGADYVDGSSSTGAFWYEAADGCDLILGGSGPDWFNGGLQSTGDDTILAGAGDDTIYSYSDNDGDDMFYGQDGNDKFIVWNNAAEEMFDGGPGVDIVSYQSGVEQTQPGTATLDGLRNDGVLGNDLVSSTVERVSGQISGVGESLVGNASDNVLNGGTGPDTIVGGLGTDVLKGNSGDDSINSRDGQADIVDCGTGTEDSATVDAGLDTVTGCEVVTPL